MTDVVAFGGDFHDWQNAKNVALINSLQFPQLVISIVEHVGGYRILLSARRQPHSKVAFQDGRELNGGLKQYRHRRHVMRSPESQAYHRKHAS